MKRFSFFILAVCCTIAAHAQNKDFSGAWNFSSQESVSGRLYSNGSPKKITIKQSGTDIILETITAGANGDVSASLQLKFDGTPAETTTQSGRKKTVTVTWNGTGSFTTQSTVFNAADPAKKDFITTDIYTLEDGELVLQRKAENRMNGEVWESKAFYNK